MTNVNQVIDNIDFLACTSCGGERLTSAIECLQCLDCNASFRKIREVPRFVCDDDYAGSFGFQWNVHARTQLDSFTNRWIRSICLGVIQHTPDPAQAFSCLANCVRPGGELVIDVYAARLRSLLSWKYVLRPLTKRMNKNQLYSFIEAAVPALLPVSEF